MVILANAQTRTADPLVRALLDNSPATAQTEPHLRSVIDGITGVPGKLVRARLTETAARIHGLDEDEARQLACAIEYFHLASLLLDDLPCMDDAEVRRGQPCAHREHGEASAILGSLGLINRAYALVQLALLRQPEFIRLQACACVDACLGVSGLVGGQARDLRFAEGEQSARMIGRIALAKTGALFWLAAYLPALPSGPSAEERRALKALCVYWGLAFQTLDDLGDILGGSDALAKTRGRDRILSRPNLALALGVPLARRRVARLARLAEQTVRRLETADPKRWSYLRSFQLELFPARVRDALQAA